MPVHDWSEVEAGIFHDFHQAWTIEIIHALNGNRLRPGYFVEIVSPAIGTGMV